jgi:hypothetical protein
MAGSSGGAASSRQGPSPRIWLLASVGAVVLALLVVLDLELTQILDPDRPVRELALRDARAGAELDFAQVWRDYSPCFQRRNPRADYIAAQSQPDQVQHYRAPADTRYSVVAVTADGIYRRVEVRVEAPGFPPLDYELDVRMYGGRWVLVDRGGLGHPIRDDCVQRGG